MSVEVLNPGHDTVILASTILNGCVRGEDGTPGDAYYRADWYARVFDATVVVNNRVDSSAVNPRRHSRFLLGVPRAFDPPEYITQAVQDAVEIDETLNDLDVTPTRLISFDASGGASHRLKMLETEKHPIPDTGIFYDSNAMKNAAKDWPWPAPQTLSFVGWGLQQALREIRRPAAARNQHPAQDLSQAELGLLDEMSLYSKEWTTDFALQIYRKIAEGKLARGSKTRIIIPAKTFTQSKAAGRQNATALNDTATEHGVDLRVCYNEPNLYALSGNEGARGLDLYHSATDDPAICTTIIEKFAPLAKKVK